MNPVLELVLVSRSLAGIINVHIVWKKPCSEVFTTRQGGRERGRPTLLLSWIHLLMW